MNEIHPDLRVLFIPHSAYAEIRMNGTQIYWTANRGKERHFITLFQDEYEAMKEKLRSKNDDCVQWHGNVRFVSTFE